MKVWLCLGFSALAAVAAAESPVALHRDGQVVTSDVEEWSRYIQLDKGTPSSLPLARKIEEIVILRTLAGRLERTPDAALGFSLRSQHLAWRLAEKALRRAVGQARPSEAEVRALYDERRGALDRPRMWRLADIFKAFPPAATDADKERVRADARALRARIAAGESFATLASSESSSSTRLREGAMGFVRLDQLAPEVAAVVSQLKAGDLSAPIELAQGITLLQCSQVVEPEPATWESARGRLEAELRGQKSAREWAELERRAVLEMAPVWVSAGTAGDPVLVRVDSGGRQQREIRVSEVSAFAEDAQPLAPDALRGAAERLIRLEGLAREAARRGLTSAPDHELLLRWKRLELAAQTVANAQGWALAGTPTEGELRAAFDADPGAWMAPRQRRVRELSVPIRSHLPASLYARFRQMQGRIAAGEETLASAHAALGPPTQLRELGWLSDDGVWQLGLNVEASLAELDRPGLTPVVQEGPRLLILELLEVRPARALPYQEARELVRGRLMRQRRLVAADRLRAQVLAEQAIRPPAP